MESLIIVCGLLMLCVVVLFVKWFLRSHIIVNCWFCNKNCSVPKSLVNKWKCQHCDQYNGFLQDGDYNCDIETFSNVSLNTAPNFCSRLNTSPSAFKNNLCSDCNSNQEKKISLLASFEPVHPGDGEKEIENFRENLERAYRLCPACEVVLEETLARKKTLILASNLNLTGLKINYENQGCFKQRAWKTLSGFSTLLALSVALSLTTSLVMTLVILPDRPVYSSQKCLNSPFLVQSLQFCPVVTSDVTTENVLDRLSPGLKMLKSYLLTIALCNLSFQFILTVFSGNLWTSALASLFQAMVLFLQHLDYSYVTSNSVPHHIQALQVLLSWSVVVLCFMGSRLKKSRALTPLKRLGNFQPKFHHETSFSRNTSEQISKTFIQAPPLYNSSDSFSELSPAVSFPVQVELSPKSHPNYLTLPKRSAARQDTAPSVPASLVAHESSPILPYEQQSSALQEDARSDASVDSAFSNADSAILDSTEFNSALSSCSESHRERTQELEVHSLINGLTLGSCQRTQSRGHAFMTQRYGKTRKAPFLLKPSKLDDTLNHSWNSTACHDTEKHHGLPSAFIPVSDQSSNTRCVSPSGSVHSQATQSSILSESAIVPSFMQTWSGPRIVQNPVSLLPHSPYTAFGSHALFSSAQFPQVVCTSYGLNHQPLSPLWNPSAFAIPPSHFMGAVPDLHQRKSPYQKNRKRADVLGYDSDDDIDVSSSANSLRKSHSVNLSSSFVDSVWQSRSVIIYTTACYAVVGCAVFAFYYQDRILNVLGGFL